MDPNASNCPVYNMNSQLSNAIEGWLFFFLLKNLYYQ